MLRGQLYLRGGITSQFFWTGGRILGGESYLGDVIGGETSQFHVQAGASYLGANLVVGVTPDYENSAGYAKIGSGNANDAMTGDLFLRDGARINVAAGGYLHLLQNSATVGGIDTDNEQSLVVVSGVMRLDLAGANVQRVLVVVNIGTNGNLILGDSDELRLRGTLRQPNSPYDLHCAGTVYFFSASTLDVRTSGVVTGSVEILAGNDVAAYWVGNLIIDGGELRWYQQNYSTFWVQGNLTFQGQSRLTQWVTATDHSLLEVVGTLTFSNANGGFCTHTVNFVSPEPPGQRRLINTTGGITIQAQAYTPAFPQGWTFGVIGNSLWLLPT
jgi:hypothetical protein